MQHKKDVENRTHAFTFDTPMDLIDSAERGYARKQLGSSLWGGGWSGKSFESWNGVRKSFLEPWTKGISKVQDMLDEIKSQQLPRPKSRRRKRRWSEDDGEVDVDRVMAGDSDFYNEIRREQVHGPSNVLLLTNLDAYGGDSPEKIFWRGAAAIAAADLIEDAGYAVEIWVWCRGNNVYRAPNSGQFHTFPLKKSGEPIDIGTMINSLSGWFLRTVIFNTFADGAPAVRTGGPEFTLGDMRKYIDPGTDMIEIQMPVAETKAQATTMAKQMLENLIAQQQS